MKIFIILSFLLLINNSFVKAQNEKDIMFFIQKTSIKKHQHIYKLEGNSHNELYIIFKGLFLFYKKYISSQDSGNCNFHPSCSVYSIHSIQKNGVVIGLMDSFDRLTRCNSINKSDYPIHEESKLLYDPIY